jgi:hypothetical protein
MVRAKAVKAYRFNCWVEFALHRSELRGRTKFAVTFHPPSARRMDTDGMISRFKAGQDALSEVAGVDDYHFEMTYKRGEPRKGGQVVVS